VKLAPQNPSNLSNGSAAKLTEARPAHHAGVGELGDLCGRTAPVGFVSRSKLPKPGIPEGLCEAGDVGRFGEVGGAGDEQRAAESRRATALTYEPHAPSAARFGWRSPGLRHIVSGLMLEVEMSGSVAGRWP